MFKSATEQTNSLFVISFIAKAEAGIALVTAPDERTAVQILRNSGKYNFEPGSYVIKQARNLGLSSSIRTELLEEAYVNALEASQQIEDALASIQGSPGPPGDQGDPGKDGKSAYQIAVEHGYTGTESEWIGKLSRSQQYYKNYTKSAILHPEEGDVFIDTFNRNIPFSGQDTSISIPDGTTNIRVNFRAKIPAVSWTDSVTGQTYSIGGLLPQASGWFLHYTKNGSSYREMIGSGGPIPLGATNISIENEAEILTLTNLRTTQRGLSMYLNGSWQRMINTSEFESLEARVSALEQQNQ